MRPAVSVVVEAYNEEANGLAPPAETLQALFEQDFPLESAELVLIGSNQQIAHWNNVFLEWPRFLRVRMLPVDPQDSHYWRLKNKAAECAEGELVALIDCDVLPSPHWLSSGVSAIRAGADASVGPSSYRTAKLRPDSVWMMAAALPSWSFALAFNSPAQTLGVNALMAHNLIIRREWLVRYPFPGLGRSFNSSLLFFQLKRAGARFSYQPGQRVAHGMTFSWWLSRMHFRRGWETYEGRDADPSWPRIPLLEKFRWIEPLPLRMGLVGRDARHWFRFSRVLGVSRVKAILMFPLAFAASFCARTAEMIGMYAALWLPKATQHQARF